MRGAGHVCAAAFRLPHFFQALTVSFALLLPFADPAAARPARGADGIWAGTIELPGFRRGVAVALAERLDGRLVGYVIGGTGERTVVSGRRVDRDVTLALEMRTPGGTHTVTIDGKLAGHAINGTAKDGVGMAKIALRSIPGVLHERRFLVALPSAGPEPDLVAEIAVALDDAGTLVAGGWVGIAGCEPWGCDGDVTSFRESAGVLVIGFRNDDPCSAGSDLNVTLDGATKIYAGSYRLNTCSGATEAEALAARATRTRSDHVAQVLAALGALGDDLEGASLLSPPHPSFSPDYSHSRLDLGGLLEKYNAEKRAYRDIVATFRRVSLITTVPEPDSLLDPVPLGALFEEIRSGVPTTGTERVTYVDSTAGWMPPRLRIWAEEAGRWLIRGNGIPPLDFPFAYTLGTNALEVPFGDGSGGGAIHVTIGPYGAHFAPHTGHPNGDAKANLAGFYSASDADLTPHPATGELAYYDPTFGTRLLARRPLYIAPEDATVTALRCVRQSTGGLGGEFHNWSIHLALRNGDSLGVGHLGKLAPAFVSRLRLAGVDLGTPPRCLVEDGSNLLGSITFPVARGDALGYPQLHARELRPDLARGYFVGGGTFADRPWTQMEFFFTAFEGERGEIGADACVYDYVRSELRPALQRVLDADMTDPTAQRYRNPRYARWRWAAEGRLCMAHWPLPRDFSSLYTDLGGWYEMDAGSIVSDEIVAFAPIAMDGASYDPANYTPGVATLILRQHPDGVPYWWTLPPVPGAGSLVVRTFDPAGEIVEQTASSMLVRWRDLATTHPSIFQRVAYLLDPTTGLRMHWGNFAATPAEAVLPALTPQTPCDGVSVVCYDHTYHPGY